MTPRKFAEEYWYLIAILILLPFAVARISGVGFGQLAGDKRMSRKATLDRVWVEDDTLVPGEPLVAKFKVTQHADGQQTVLMAHFWLDGKRIWTNLNPEETTDWNPVSKQSGGNNWPFYWEPREAPRSLVFELNKTDLEPGEHTLEGYITLGDRTSRDGEQDLYRDLSEDDVIVTGEKELIGGKIYLTVKEVNWDVIKRRIDMGETVSPEAKTDSYKFEKTVRVFGKAPKPKPKPAPRKKPPAPAPKVPSWVYPLMAFVVIIGAGMATIILKRRGMI